MVIYNITFKISLIIKDAWLDWLSTVQIPGVIATGLFSTHQLFHLLEQDDSEGVTYILQYYTTSLDNYKIFVENFAAAMEKRAHEKWKNEFVSFQTVMKAVN